MLGGRDTLCYAPRGPVVLLQVRDARNTVGPHEGQQMRRTCSGCILWTGHTAKRKVVALVLDEVQRCPSIFGELLEHLAEPQSNRRVSTSLPDHTGDQGLEVIRDPEELWKGVLEDEHRHPDGYLGSFR